MFFMNGPANWLYSVWWKAWAESKVVITLLTGNADNAIVQQGELHHGGHWEASVSVGLNVCYFYLYIFVLIIKLYI